MDDQTQEDWKLIPGLGTLIILTYDQQDGSNSQKRYYKNISYQEAVIVGQVCSGAFKWVPLSEASAEELIASSCIVPTAIVDWGKRHENT